MVHACTMIIVHPCTMNIAHACTMIIVHASIMIMVHACTMIIAHASTMIIVHAFVCLSVCVCLCLCIYLSLSGRLEPRLPEHSSARHCVHPSERSSDDPFNIWSSLAIIITSLAAMPNVCRGGSRLRFGMWRRLMRTHW